MVNSKRASFHAALKLPERKFIEMPHCTEVLNALNYSFGRAIAGEPSGLIISGGTGVGKSSIIEFFKQSWDEELVEGECSPIVIIETPARPTDNELLEAELIALGDPAPRKGDISSKKARRDALFETLGIKIAIYDDFQHIVEQRGDKVARRLLDEYKALSKRFCISFVFTGIDSVVLVGIVNEQIGSRFSILQRVRVMSVENDQEFYYFEAFIESMGKTKNFMDTNLIDENFVYRLYYVCRGDLRILNDFINKALYEFIISGDKKLKLEHFKSAFESFNPNKWFNKDLKSINPFNTKKLTTLKNRLGVK
jgi:hypothetical protein